MRKRDKMRAKRDRLWARMDEDKSRRKAESGICMLIAMIFCLGTIAMCAPDADARSRSSSRSSSSKSYSKPAPRKVVAKPAPKMILTKKTVVTTVVAGAAVGTVVASSQQSKAKATGTKKRYLKKGMYEKNGLVCKKNKYTGREKCKSKAAYYFDDVLDADDWFEDDEEYQQPQQTQQSGMNGAELIIWLWFMGFFIIIAIIIAVLMSRRK